MKTSHAVTHIARRDPGSPTGRFAIVDELDNLRAVFGDDAGRLPERLRAVGDELADLLHTTAGGNGS